MFTWHWVGVQYNTIQYNDKTNLYSAIIRNAEALDGDYVSHNAVKKASFQSLFIPKVSELTILSGSVFQRSVQRRRKHGWQKLFEFEKRLASVRGLTAVVQRGRVVRAVTEDTLVSMSILPCSIQLPVCK